MHITLMRMTSNKVGAAVAMIVPVREASAGGIVVRLFRIWSALREVGTPYLPCMQDLIVHLRLPDETAVACASLFELLEGQLGRRLNRECCCSQTMTTDEMAILGVLRHAPSVNAYGATENIPHGLPGAIVWAAMSVRRALGMRACAHSAEMGNGTCPFINAAEKGSPS